jgi:hypothetical protein
MKKEEITKKVRETVKFYFGEFYGEIFLGEFNFAEEEKALIKELVEDADFEPSDAKEIAAETRLRLETFATRLREAKAEALQKK